VCLLPLVCYALGVTRSSPVFTFAVLRRDGRSIVLVEGLLGPRGIERLRSAGIDVVSVRQGEG
jgi:predicted Fe-Mo cluster-binding NifX family protein